MADLHLKAYARAVAPRCSESERVVNPQEERSGVEGFSFRPYLLGYQLLTRRKQTGIPSWKRTPLKEKWLQRVSRMFRKQDGIAA